MPQVMSGNLNWWEFGCVCLTRFIDHTQMPPSIKFGAQHGVAAQNEKITPLPNISGIQGGVLDVLMTWPMAALKTAISAFRRVAAMAQ